MEHEGLIESARAMVEKNEQFLRDSELRELKRQQLVLEARLNLERAERILDKASHRGILGRIVDGAMDPAGAIDRWFDKHTGPL